MEAPNWLKGIVRFESRVITRDSDFGEGSPVKPHMVKARHPWFTANPDILALRVYDTLVLLSRFKIKIPFYQQ